MGELLGRVDRDGREGGCWLNPFEWPGFDGGSWLWDLLEDGDSLDPAG